jgi:hypothetical protein
MGTVDLKKGLSRIGRKGAASLVLSMLAFGILYLTLATGWKAREGALAITVVSESPGNQIGLEIDLPPGFDATGSISNSSEPMKVEISGGRISVQGATSANFVFVDLGPVTLSSLPMNVMDPLPLTVAATANVTIYVQLIVRTATHLGTISSYSNLYAAHFDGANTPMPLFENYSNERLRVGDCAIWFSATISLAVLGVSSMLLDAPWGGRFPVVTCVLMSLMFGLYVYAGSGLDLLLAGHFSALNGPIVLTLGPLLHTSFSHLFNNLFFGLIPAGLAFEVGLRWKSRRAMASIYLASFFLVHFLIAAVSYQLHGMPSIGASYPIISLSTVLVAFFFMFRDRLVSDAVEKKAPARLVALFACGAYPLLRGVYDWTGYMIEYSSNWSVVGEGMSHLLVFAFTLFIIISARDPLSKEGPILGI